MSKDVSFHQTENSSIVTHEAADAGNVNDDNTVFTLLVKMTLWSSGETPGFGIPGGWSNVLRSPAGSGSSLEVWHEI